MHACKHACVCACVRCARLSACARDSAQALARDAIDPPSPLATRSNNVSLELPLLEAWHDAAALLLLLPPLPPTEPCPQDAGAGRAPAQPLLPLLLQLLVLLLHCPAAADTLCWWSIFVFASANDPHNRRLAGWLRIPTLRSCAGVAEVLPTTGPMVGQSQHVKVYVRTRPSAKLGALK